MKNFYHFSLLGLIIALSVSNLTANGLSFIPNQGQIANLKGEVMQDVLFVSYQGDAALYFYKDKIAFCTRAYYNEETSESKRLRAEGNLAEAQQHEVRTRDYRFDIIFQNASSEVSLAGQESKAHYYNYYYGHCPDGITKVPDFSKLRYNNIYPNIDLVFYAGTKGMKYDFIVHPGGNPDDIQLKFDGVTSLSLQDGNLEVNSPLLNYTDEKPYTYQDENTEVEAAFSVEENLLSFNLGKYDESKDLIIDPTIYWSTYFNSRSTVWGNMSILSDGSFFQSAYQYNQTAPYFDAGTFFNNTHEGSNTDILFTKFSVDGVQQWTTLYGGTGYEYLINNTTTVDANDNMYFGGQTRSADFPIQNAGGYFRPVLDGDGTGTDAFILKFDASGNRLWATYWGGSSGDRIRAMQCHPVNNKLYVIGETYSTNLPIQALTGAYNDASHNSSQDIFIARFSTATELEWSTYFGGSGSEHAHHIDFDSNGNMYMVGEHGGWSVPSTSPPLVNPGGGAHFDNTVNGKQDLYINKFNSSGQHVWGTYYGGNFNDNYNGDCSGMSIKSNNNIVICGKTASDNFPTTSRSGAYNDATHNGTPDSDNDGYIVEFNPAGVIQWATYYGGSGSEELRNLDHDDSDNLLVGGFTTSLNIPLQTHAGSYNQSYAGSTDGLILWFDANGARQWATCVGTANAEDIRPFGVTTVAYNPFSILTSTANASVGLGMPVVNPGGGAYNDNGGVGMWFARFDQGSPLPVDLVSFDAHLNLNKDVLCRWTVASELNNKGFSVERSADGIEWASIGFVDGRGTASDAANYRFLDENPLTGYSYYRLKQMDFDGQFTNSNVVSVQLLENFDEEVLIYPNPADEQLFIELAEGLDLQQVRIFDVLGRELRTFNNVQNAIPTADLNAGVYLISLEFPHKTINKKIRIE